VASELEDPDSVLQFYKHLLALRHHEPALLNGDYVALNQDNPNVLSYVRRYKNEAVVVALNMSAIGQQISFNLSEQGFSAANATTLMPTSSPQPSGRLDHIALEPFAVYIARVSR
jgi:glycosidase